VLLNSQSFCIKVCKSEGPFQKQSFRLTHYGDLTLFYTEVSCPLLPKFGENDSIYPGLRDTVAIGLRKLYAKSESGTNLVMCDVY
jgi:hypothetical protein